jgi:hypothetical protein
MLAKVVGHDLASLRRQVQRAVAVALRDALAQLARDVVDRELQRQPSERLAREPRPDDYDPWAYGDPPDEWEEPPPEESSEEGAPSSPIEVVRPAPLRSAVAVAVAVAAWWLRRSGGWLGALGVGLVVGVGAAIAPQLASGSLPLLHSAEELLTLHRAVSAVAGGALDNQLP